MLRNLGISLLLLGLLGATIDGFRVRESARVSPGTTTATEDQDRVHASDAMGVPPN
jgi:hypothetical protein